MTDGGNFRVLVVDDDEIAVAAISHVLSEAGCTVSHLSTPIGASQVAIDLKVDVVILDLHMPALPGDRLAAMLRGNKRLQDIPVVIVSAAADEELAAIMRRLPGVIALPKRRVRRELANVVTTLAVRRRSTPGGASSFVEQNVFSPSAGVSMMPGAAQSAASEAAPGSPIAEEFCVALPRRLVRTVKLWREASCGSERAYRDLAKELDEIRGECQALDMVALADLVRAVESLVGALQAGRNAGAGTSTTVLAGLNLIARLARDPGAAREKEVSAMVERLSFERQRLLDTPPLVEIINTRLPSKGDGAA